MSGERKAALDAALVAALEADGFEASSRTRRVISLLRREIEGVPIGTSARGIGPVQGRFLTALVDDGPQTEDELRSEHVRATPMLAALLARGLVETIPQEGQPCLWCASSAGRDWVECRHPA